MVRTKNIEKSNKQVAETLADKTKDDLLRRIFLMPSLKRNLITIDEYLPVF